MNERIRELALRCDEEVGDYQYGSIRSFNYEKFAGLIVQECANIVQFLQDHGREDIADDLKKHFGVDHG